jgi:hypothetical protein
VAVALDGKLLPDNLIPPLKDGREHTIEVTLSAQ